MQEKFAAEFNVTYPPLFGEKIDAQNRRVINGDENLLYRTLMGTSGGRFVC